MEKFSGRRRRQYCSSGGAFRCRWAFYLYLFIFIICFSAIEKADSAAGDASAAASVRRSPRSNSLGVQLVRKRDPNRVIIDNGIVRVTFSSPDGDIIGIKYKGVDNVLEILNEDDNRGLAATDFRVVIQDEDQVEVSFTKKWRPSDDTVPLNIDKRYILRRGSSGIYMYTILERLQGWPDVDMDQIRVVFKLQQKLFNFMAISDYKQRVMPMPEDRVTGQPLAYPEAVLLTHPINPDLRGEVDDKYQYSCEDKDNKVHGWISEDPAVGFWMITPSNEFRVGGPIKQDLTSHVGPIVLNMFTSTHYAGKDLNTAYRNGEPWKKVLGPVFVYLNSGDTSTLWRDAKQQMHTEVKSWPYDFVNSEDFPTALQRGSVVGQLILRDRYINEKLMYAASAYVGLALPGEVGSWQTDAKGYQFWTQADRRGSKIDLGMLLYDPPRNGPTLWEIGIPDRKAAEFHVPDAYPTLMNKLYTDRPTDRFRQYGLWSRYADIYPRQDLVYEVGVSNFFEDWFFAHVSRNVGNNTFRATTWKINFDLTTVNKSGDYTLQLALASATASELQVRLNNPNAREALFSTGMIGKDNAIARHGIHGLYWLYSISVPSNQLVDGKNSIYLTQTKSDGPFHGVIYDYIRLEGPRGT
ncbi:Rhamnogalacturonate lyase [Linum perenne]